MVFPDISLYPRFCYDESGAVVNGNCYWMCATTETERQLLLLVEGVCNSDVMVKYHIRFYAGVFHLDSPNIPCEKALFNARHGYFHSVENELDYTFTDLRLLNRANYVRSLQKKLWKANT